MIVFMEGVLEWSESTSRTRGSSRKLNRSDVLKRKRSVPGTYLDEWHTTNQQDGAGGFDDDTKGKISWVSREKASKFGYF